VQVMGAVSAMQATGHDTLNSSGSIVPRPCKERKDGAPPFRIGKKKGKDGPPASAMPGQ
jgi:hypothetical protein